MTELEWLMSSRAPGRKSGFTNCLVCLPQHRSISDAGAAAPQAGHLRSVWPTRPPSAWKKADGGSPLQGSALNTIKPSQGGDVGWSKGRSVRGSSGVLILKPYRLSHVKLNEIIDYKVAVIDPHEGQGMICAEGQDGISVSVVG